MPRRAFFAAVALALALVSACSNTNSAVSRRPHEGTATASDVGGLEQVTIQATDTDRFIPSTIYVHAGKTVRVTLVHVGDQAPHNWQLTKLPSAFVPLLTAQGQQGSTTFVAPSPGRSQYVCTIHVAAGQTGALVVLP